MLFSAIDLVFVTVFRIMWGQQSYGILGIAFGMVILLIVQLIAGIVVDLNEKEKLYGKALMLSGLVLLVVGFGICTIGS